jgi:hypothetical protein
MLVGSILQGYVIQAHSAGDKVDWAPTWLIPAAGSLGVLILFLGLFREPKRATQPA